MGARAWSYRWRGERTLQWRLQWQMHDGGAGVGDGVRTKLARAIAALMHEHSYGVSEG